MVDPIQAPASDAPGSAGEAVGPHRALHPAVPCREKHCALDLVVPCKEKRDSGGEVTRTKVRVTEADLESNGGAANVLATTPAASEPCPTGGGQAGCAAREQVWFDVGRADAALTAVSDDTAVRRDRTARSSGALGK